MLSTDKLTFHITDLLIPAVAVLLAGVLMVLSAVLPQPERREAMITVDGEVIAVLPLETDADRLFELSAGGVNRVVVTDGCVSVSEADCATQVCVHHRAISRVGESIVCAPHGLVVTVVGGEAADAPDLIAR
ncbi:MAG: NusG domain II-containing protein [Clostridia bacterium]|nr:NusG domain II-containing protein [Clostridia bacterium]